MNNENIQQPTKIRSLKQSGTFNKEFKTIKDQLFLKHDFFDSKDLVQVKYEMLRRVKKDGWSISLAAKSYRFSRPLFYEAQANLEKSGVPGLIPKRRGPHRSHKLTDEILVFADTAIQTDKTLTAEQLRSIVSDRFGVKIHPRSISRALAMWKKKRKTLE